MSIEVPITKATTVFATLATSILLYTSIPKETILVYLALNFSDVIIGTLASIKYHTFKFSCLTTGIITKMVTVMLPLLVIVGLTSLNLINETITQFSYVGIMAFFILGELHSVMSNLHYLKKGDRLPEIDTLIYIDKKVRKLLRKFINV